MIIRNKGDINIWNDLQIFVASPFRGSSISKGNGSSAMRRCTEKSLKIMNSCSKRIPTNHKAGVGTDRAMNNVKRKGK